MISVHRKTTRGPRNSADHTTDNMGKAKYCLSTKYHLFCVLKGVEPCGECLCFYYRNTYTPRTEVTEALEILPMLPTKKCMWWFRYYWLQVCIFFQLLTSVLVFYNSWVPLRFSRLDRISEYCIQIDYKVSNILFCLLLATDSEFVCSERLLFKSTLLYNNIAPMRDFNNTRNQHV